MQSAFPFGDNWWKSGEQLPEVAGYGGTGGPPGAWHLGWNKKELEPAEEGWEMGNREA